MRCSEIHPLFVSPLFVPLFSPVGFLFFGVMVRPFWARRSEIGRITHKKKRPVDAGRLTQKNNRHIRFGQGVRLVPFFSRSGSYSITRGRTGVQVLRAARPLIFGQITTIYNITFVRLRFERMFFLFGVVLAIECVCRNGQITNIINSSNSKE